MSHSSHFKVKTGSESESRTLEVEKHESHRKRPAKFKLCPRFFKDNLIVPMLDTAASGDPTAAPAAAVTSAVPSAGESEA